MAAPEAIAAALAGKGLARTSVGQVEHMVRGEGRPLWLMFNGAGMSMDTWHRLFPRLDRLGTVLLWNRFGLGRSDPPSGRHAPGSSTLLALRELLDQRGLRGPCVLVGHSLGALHAELFARLYPREVQAVALLDPSDPREAGAVQSVAPRLAQAIGRLFPMPVHRFRANLETELAWTRESAAAVASAGPFPPVPLLVISGGRAPARWLADPEAVRRRREYHASLARLSPAGEHVVLPHSGHFPQRTDPDRVVQLLERLHRRAEDLQAVSPR